MSFRFALNTLGLAFATYLAFRGILPADPVAHREIALTAVALFLVCMVVALFAHGIGGRGRHSGGRLPPLLVVFIVGMSGLIPWLACSGVDLVYRFSNQVTWFVGAVGTLLTVLVIRRHVVAAWVGVGFLVANCFILFGPINSLAFGLVGSLLWVSLANAMLAFTDRSYADTVRLVALQQASSAWQSSHREQERERRQRVQYALSVAGPVLAEVIARDGEIDERLRSLAWRAEGTLRDELRGAKLLDDEVRAQIAELRGRDVLVTVMDDGGLEEFSAQQLDRIRAEIASVLADCDAERIIIRTSTIPNVSVTIVGRSVTETEDDDDDDVTFWHEVPRPVG